ncbi:hypothetical protein SCUP515_13222 [Seiridium cupressi]
MSCSNIDGDLAPFCEPANNTQVSPGEKVIGRLVNALLKTITNSDRTVKWDSSFFTDASTLIQIQADFSPSSGEDATPLADDGFTSNSLRATTTSYEWTVSSSILNSTDSNGVNAQLYIVVATSDGGSENRTLGPLVRVLPAGSTSSESSAAGPNLVAIIVPVVVGVLLLMAIAGFLLMKRRNPDWTLRGMVGMGKRNGYGSRSERAVGAGGAGAGGVQMGDMGISRPQDGRNVFREEIKR